jgi:hypothetical protein
MKQTVSIAGRCQGPEPLTGARLCPPVETSGMLEGNKRGQLDQIFLKKTTEVV